MLLAHRPELEALIDMLVEAEVLDGSAVYAVLGAEQPEAGAHACATPQRAPIDA